MQHWTPWFARTKPVPRRHQPRGLPSPPRAMTSPAYAMSSCSTTPDGGAPKRGAWSPPAPRFPQTTPASGLRKSPPGVLEAPRTFRPLGSEAHGRLGESAWRREGPQPYGRRGEVRREAQGTHGHLGLRGCAVVPGTGHRLPRTPAPHLWPPTAGARPRGDAGPAPDSRHHRRVPTRYAHPWPRAPE